MDELRVCEMFTRVGIVRPDGVALRDRHYRFTCPDCGELQTLEQATIAAGAWDGAITEYQCRRCTAPVVATARWGSAPPPGWTDLGFQDYSLQFRAPIIQRIGATDMTIE